VKKKINSMKKYLPYFIILITIVFTIWNVKDELPIGFHLPSFFMIAAMLFIIYQNRKNNKRKNL